MGILGYGYKTWKGYKKAKATKKMLSGTSTKAERLKYGERGPTLKKVKPAVKIPGATKTEIERSRQRGHTTVYGQRSTISKDLNKKIKEGKEAVRKKAHLAQTKVLKTHPGGTVSADPFTGQNKKTWSELHGKKGKK